MAWAICPGQRPNAGSVTTALPNSYERLRLCVCLEIYRIYAHGHSVLECTPIHSPPLPPYDDFAIRSKSQTGASKCRRLGRQRNQREQRTWTKPTRGQPSYPASRAIKAALINFPAVVRVIPVQPRFARKGRIGLREPERTARSNRVGVADRMEEPVPGLAAADRAGHGVRPGLGRDRAIAPCAHSGHSRTSFAPRTSPKKSGRPSSPRSSAPMPSLTGTPERRQAGDQCASAATAANTAAKPLDNAGPG